MQTPFYSIKCLETGLDVGALCMDFRLEICKDEDDMLTLNIADPSEALIDGPTFVKGNTLQFRFGYIGGKQSGLWQAVIEDVRTTYDRETKMKITAHDAGRSIKKVTSNRIWQDMTASEIVNEIASQFGMKAIVSDTKRVYKELPQANMSYYDFMVFLTNGFDSAVLTDQMNFFIQNDTIHFTRMKLNENSRVTYTRRPANQNNEVLYFDPHYESDSKGATESTTAFTIDTETNAVIQSSGDLSQTTVLASAETKGRKYDVDANLIESDSGKIIVRPADDQEELDSIANDTKNKATMDELVASLKTIGDPYAQCDQIITINGVAKRYAGNWYTEKVIHTIARGGYVCDFDLKKNTSNTAEAAGEANADVGGSAEQQQRKEAIRKYDVDGNQLNANQARGATGSF